MPGAVFLKTIARGEQPIVVEGRNAATGFGLTVTVDVEVVEPQGVVTFKLMLYLL